MNPLKSMRIKWLLWLASLGSLVAFILSPASYLTTRLAILILSFVVWFGLLALLRRQRALFNTLLAATLLIAGFLCLPARNALPREALRASYIAALQRYDGVIYYWGGENSRGIDCSGLIRRGLIDASFQYGIRTFDAGLVRQAISLWWNDCTARALGEQYRNLTVHQFDIPSINSSDATKLLPGDLAVTKNGLHIMAYLVENSWIEADPKVGRVIIVTPPSTNPWFQLPMNIVRWTALQ